MARKVKNTNPDALKLADDPHYMLINIPFYGFYESLYSSEVDSEDERAAEDFENGEGCDGEENVSYPPELQLDASEYSEILFEHTNYSEIYASIAHSYADAFNNVLSEALPIRGGLGLVYEGMDSPSYYNFETDRIFCYIRKSKVRRMLALSKRDGHKTLAKLIEERHSSRSGFHSFYSNALAEWLAKDVTDWDHNELCTLIMAVWTIYSGESKRDADDSLRWAVYYATTEDGIYQEVDSGRDWAKIEEAVRELREEKRADYESRMGGEGLPPLKPKRCDSTPDMFSGR